MMGFGGGRVGWVFLALLVLLSVCFSGVCFGVGLDEASLALGEAEADLGLAFVAVAEAEKAGANVSVLVARLVSAGELLADAYAAFKVGDYASAKVLAEECNVAVDGIVGEAEGLRGAAEVARRDLLFWTALGSGIGVVVFLVVGFVVWGFVKRRFVERVLELKPEVGVSE